MTAERRREERGALEAFKRTFLHPFLDWRRSAIFFGVLSGYYGFTLVNVTSAYDLGGVGLIPLLSYFGPMLVLSGFIFFPLLYMGFCTIDSTAWRIVVLLAQAFAFVGFLALPKEPLYQGLAGGMLAAPFWTGFHISMVQNTTSQNRAFEVSLASFLGIVASTAAMLTSGVLLASGHAQIAIHAAFVALLLGSFCVLLATKKRSNASVSSFLYQARTLIHENPYLIRRIIAQSLHEMPSFTLATLMYLLNFSATMTSLMLASRIVAEFLLAPVVGHYVHTRRNKGFGLGMLLIASAWLLLLISSKGTISVIAFMITFGIGLRFVANSLISGLYEMQKYASMMWTEIFLCVGRALSMVFILPLLYYDPRLYMIALALLAGLLVILNQIWMRKFGINTPAPSAELTL